MPTKAKTKYEKTGKQVKFHVDLTDDERAVFAGESMWADELTSRAGATFYRVANIPFFAFDINEDDVVAVDDAGEFKYVVERSGNCTLRAYLPKDSTDDDLRQLAALVTTGGALGTEGGFSMILAINVTTEKFQDVAELLESLREDGKIAEWETGSVPADD